MRVFLISFLVISFLLNILKSQDTFSVVAADSTTREVGSAGASCVDLFAAGFSNIGFLGDLLPDTGAINTQAAYFSTNQNNARKRMRAGDSLQQIINWLIANDAQSDPTTRQYGMVAFNGTKASAAGYTGVNCIDYKNHLTGNIDGISYSIQGNILLGQEILDSMEARFRRADGDLACRLMAALQGAKVIGADTRCALNNSSTLFAFVKVAQPNDKYGSPSLNIGVRTRNNAFIEPVDSLQALFNLQHACLPNSTREFGTPLPFSIYPNPSSRQIVIVFDEKNASFRHCSLKLFDSSGKYMFETIIENGKTELNMSYADPGMYYYQFHAGSKIIDSGKFVLE